MSNLYFKVLGDDNKPPLVIIHGFLGSSDNWLTLARKWSEHFKVLLYDQRNHGRSFHSEVWNYDSMVDDLKLLLDTLKMKNSYILGHSMGGKTAQFFVNKYPNACAKLVVVDMGVKKYEPDHNYILEAMKGLDTTAIRSRNDADELLKLKIPNLGLRLFILKNLTRSDDNHSFKWKANVNVFYNNKEVVGSGVPQQLSFDKPVLFLYGGKSNYVLDADKDAIKKHYKDIHFKVIPHAGHWLHAEAPKEMTEILYHFFNV